jgi:choline-sulfatase
MSVITRREFNKRIAAGVIGVAAFGSNALPVNNFIEGKSNGKKPNFVFICSDQHSANYGGYAGHPFIQTPNLDRIARNGVTFTSAYSGNPLCVPGRSCLLTGMYASDLNSFCNSTVMDSSYPTWGKRLRDNGYNCWATGKQDLNPIVDLGFTEVKVDHAHASNPDITSLFRRPVGYRINEREQIDGRIRTERHEDSIVTQRAIDYIKNDAIKKDQPWAVFVGLLEPHPVWSGLKEYYDFYLPKVRIPQISIEELEQLPLPYQIMRNFKRISTPIPEEKIKRAIASYFSMITELDEYIGKIYNCLEETNQIDNTYFVYTSDHGESLGDHGMWYKNNFYESCVKVPLIISNPRLPKGRKIDVPVSHVDLVATIIDLSGLKFPKDLRGISLLQLIEGDNQNVPKFVYSESHSEGNPTGSFMIRKGDWKLIHFSYYHDYLFNLKEDPGEKINRIDDPMTIEVLKDLQTLLYSRVNPEEITEKAFRTQQEMLNSFVDRMNEEELFNLTKSRVGEGQARVLAKALKKNNKN